MSTAFIWSPHRASVANDSPTHHADTRKTSVAWSHERSDHHVTASTTIPAGSAKFVSDRELSTSIATLSITGPAMRTTAGSMAASRLTRSRIQATARWRSAMPAGVKPTTAHVVRPSGPSSMPLRRSMAAVRSRPRGGPASCSSARLPVATPVNQALPAASRGASSPPDAAASASSARAPTSHPGHVTTTTSPLSKSLVKASYSCRGANVSGTHSSGVVPSTPSTPKAACAMNGAESAMDTSATTLVTDQGTARTMWRPSPANATL